MFDRAASDVTEEDRREREMTPPRSIKKHRTCRRADLAGSVSGDVQPLRGEIWEFDLNPRKGREQQSVRPCLVASTDALNRSRFGTVTLAGSRGLTGSQPTRS
jgi:hypothetical protein